MREELLLAREANERVLIFSHIPPGKFERFYQQMAEVDYPGFHWLADAFNEKYLGRSQGVERERDCARPCSMPVGHWSHISPLSREISEIF
jgi:hypothetical protein